uniref:Uncharacterized protein n=1 Tax=Grammatophora oceanica TaxID=210454 RepID=A0A7S1YNP4_9STRA
MKAARVLPAIPEGHVISSKCLRRARPPSSSSSSGTLALFASMLCLLSIVFLRLESDLGGSGHSAFFHTFEASSMMNTFVDIESSGFAKTSSPASKNQEAIHIWQESWETQGFRTRLLMADDAKKHPMYRTAEAILHRPLSPEQNYSFMRSLAMAQTGGGWLTETDIFPIVDFSSRKLPNNGKLTIHGVDNSTQAPSLISGDADEWLAYAWDVLDAATSPTHHFDEGGGPIAQHSHVIRADRLMNMNMNTTEGCSLLHGKNVYAAHFSAEAIENTDDDSLLVNMGLGARFRSTLARSWLQKYRKRCRRTRRSGGA